MQEIGADGAVDTVEKAGARPPLEYLLVPKVPWIPRQHLAQWVQAPPVSARPSLSRASSGCALRALRVRARPPRHIALHVARFWAHCYRGLSVGTYLAGRITVKVLDASRPSWETDPLAEVSTPLLSGNSTEQILSHSSARR